MENRLRLIIVLILIIGAFAYWKISHPITNEPVVVDTYIVWSATRETTNRSVDDTPGEDALYACDAFVYRYAVGTQKILKLDTRTVQRASCDYPYGFDAEQGYVFIGGTQAFNLNGKDITAQTDLQVKRGVEGYLNSTSGVAVYSEYMIPENVTIVHIYGTETAPNGFEIVNSKYISTPYYLAPIMISDDNTQVYFTEFTEASGVQRFGIHLWVYDTAKKTMNKVEYGKDLFVNEMMIDPTGKRLLVVSGTREVNEEAPGWDNLIGPSQLHLVDLVTGQGMKIGKESTDEEVLYDPHFSPVDQNIISVVYRGITNVMSIDAAGLVVTAQDLDGVIAEWNKDLLVLNASETWDVYDQAGKNKIASLPQADFDTTNGSFGFRYLGSITINRLNP